MIKKLIKPVYAHCDLFCGVYDPAQARIEAESVLNTMKKFHESDDEIFKQRCVIIKEQRAQLVKEHLWVLWTDYFKPKHLSLHDDLHDLFWRATKKASESKKTFETSIGEELLVLIVEINKVYEASKTDG